MKIQGDFQVLQVEVQSLDEFDGFIAKASLLDNTSSALIQINLIKPRMDLIDILVSAQRSKANLKEIEI